MKLYKVSYTLDPRKVLSYQMENGGSPFEKLMEALKEKLSCERIIPVETSFHSMTIVVCAEQDLSEEDFSAIHASFSETCKTGNLNMMLVATSLSEVLGNKRISEEDAAYLSSLKDVEEPAEQKTQDGSGKTEDIFEQIESLIAMDELKAWAKEMKTVLEAKTDKKRLACAMEGMTYLVSVNPGNGCSTVVTSMAEVLTRLNGKKETVVKEVFIEPDPEMQKQYNLDAVIHDFQNGSDDGCKHVVYALRIDRMQGNQFMMAWLKLMRAVWHYGRKASFLFVLPYLEHSVLEEIHRRIEDLVPNCVLAIKPMDNGNYLQLFQRYFEPFGIAVCEDAYQVFLDKIAEEKSDGRFYGIQTVHKICNELLYRKVKDAALEQGGNENEITASDVRAVMHEDLLPEGETGMEQLDSLVALNEVKRVVKEIVASIKMQRSMDGMQANSMHMMFGGAPGPGKTVVARILGKIFREEKLLSVGAFFEVSRKDLVGRYVGHTAPKTAEVCQGAYGSVLFIDEAYSLAGGDTEDFGKEAISTLIAEMENKRDDFVVIFAGYTKELEQLFDLNPGLRDRIPYRISFGSYNREELCEIFFRMLPKAFTYDDKFREAANAFFLGLSDEVVQNRNFSNGRFVRNLVERVLSKAALRLQMNQSTERLFVKSDLELAVTDVEFKTLNRKKEKPIQIGFRLDN